MTPVDLRPMAPADIPAVLAVEEASQPRPWTASFLRGELDDATRDYVVAIGQDDDGGQALVGFGGVLVAVDEAHITNVAVAPAARRGGVGRRVVQQLLDIAVSRGATAATLEVRASNTQARRLYTRMGFVPAGVRPGYYPATADGPAEDAIIMWLHDVQVREGAA